MSDSTINLTPALYAYLQQHSIREPEVLTQLRMETHQLPSRAMQISPEQGQFMRLLIEMLGARKTIDIGTYTGYSALAVALSLPEDGKVITCDVNTASTDIAKRFWQLAQVDQKIDLVIAPAMETLNQLIDSGHSNTFDFIFIDADKRNYLSYYEASLTLLRSGGLVAVDNVLWGGRVADRSDDEADTVAIRELNAKIARDERVTMSMLPIGDGLTLARKR